MDNKQILVALFLLMYKLNFFFGVFEVKFVLILPKLTSKDIIKPL